MCTPWRVVVAGEVVGEVGRGLLVLLGVAQGDTAEQARWLADKVVSLRVFEDDAGKMNRDVTEVGGGVLVVSQFTLLGDCRKGRRPSFVGAAPPEGSGYSVIAWVAGEKEPIAFAPLSVK